MSFNIENDPDLLIGVDCLGKNFSNRRNDPSIHTCNESVIRTFHYFRGSKNSSQDDFDETTQKEEINPCVEKRRKIYGKYVRVSKMAAGVARDAIFKGVELAEVYRMIAKRFMFEADALDASRKAKRTNGKTAVAQKE